MPISDLAVISGDSSSISAPSGFTKIPQDLNQGAGGKYIYLCYAERTGGEFVTDITFVVGDSDDVPAPAGYVRAGPDLNQGAKGKYIYLCYRRGPGVAIQAVKFVVADVAMPHQAADGFTMIPQDLNQGAGGKYIYLCTRRDASNWMEQLETQLGERPLARITLPGTHDSATYSITASSEFAPDSASYSQYIESIGQTVSSVSRAVIAQWARTQSYTIHEQLMAGVRYLDIRVATHGGNDDDIRITHGLWGCSVDEVLQQVRSFLDSRRKEVVLLRLAYNEPGILSSGSKRRLADRLKAQFGELLVPASLGAFATLPQIWRTSGRLIVLFDNWIHDDAALTSADRALFWKDGGTGSVVMTTSMRQGGTMDTGTLKQSLQQTIDQTGAAGGQFQRLGCCLTPSFSYMAERYARGNTNASIYEDCAKAINPLAVRWLRDDWRDRVVNIVTVDFLQLGQCVDTALLRNSRPARTILWTQLRDNFVLDVAGDNGSPGAKIISYPFKPSFCANQLWYVEASGHIRSALNPQLVLDIPGSSTTPGTAVHLWTENVPASPNQLWTFDNGFIRSRLDPTLVLDVEGANTSPGAPIIIWKQSSPQAVNQSFRREIV